jgi:hypothetical protein
LYAGHIGATRPLYSNGSAAGSNKIVVNPDSGGDSQRHPGLGDDAARAAAAIRESMTTGYSTAPISRRAGDSRVRA